MLKSRREKQATNLFQKGVTYSETKWQKSVLAPLQLGEVNIFNQSSDFGTSKEASWALFTAKVWGSTDI